MTPKEKAEQLVNKYSIVSNKLTYIDYKAAKICALIAVDEILNDYSYMQNVRNANSNQIHSQRVYWQEVKNEIEKL
jgi:hypothetical protein